MPLPRAFFFTDDAKIDVSRSGDGRDIVDESNDVLDDLLPLC